MACKGWVREEKSRDDTEHMEIISSTSFGSTNNAPELVKKMRNPFVDTKVPSKRAIGSSHRRAFSKASRCKWLLAASRRDGG